MQKCKILPNRTNTIKVLGYLKTHTNKYEYKHKDSYKDKNKITEIYTKKSKKKINHTKHTNINTLTDKHNPNTHEHKHTQKMHNQTKQFTGKKTIGNTNTF